MFLETYPCLTLYPTLCFQKQLTGRGICTFPDPQVRCTLHYKWRFLWDIPWNFGSNWFSGHAIILYVLGSQTISALYSSHLQTYQAASKAYISFSEFSMIASVWWIMHRVALYQKQLLQWFASFKKKTNCTVVDVTRKQLLCSREQLTRHLYGDNHIHTLSEGLERTKPSSPKLSLSCDWPHTCIEHKNLCWITHVHTHSSHTIAVYIATH